MKYEHFSNLPRLSIHRIRRAQSSYFARTMLLKILLFLLVLLCMAQKIPSDPKNQNLMLTLPPDYHASLLKK